MNNLSDKMNQIKALKNNKGIQYLLNAGYEILKNPIYIYDMEYKLVAHTENIVTDDLLWNELTTQGIHGEETVELFKNECFIDAVANTQTTTFLVSDQFKYNRILGKISNSDKVTVACANVVGCYKPLDDEDVVFFQALCKKISKEISKNELYQAYGERYQQDVINKLIAGHVRDKKRYTHLVSEVCGGLQNYLYIGVAEVANADHNQLVRLKSKFKQVQPKFKYSIYENLIIIIMSSDHAAFNTKRILRSLKKIAEESQISIEASDSFENPFEMQKYYIQALGALFSQSRVSR